MVRPIFIGQASISSGSMRVLKLSRRLEHRTRAKLAAVRTRLRWSSTFRKDDRPVVVIALTEHLGDIVAAEPIARHLRARHPDARLVWAVRWPYVTLLEHNPHIDAVLRVRCLSEWVSLARRNPFDTVVDLHVPGCFCSVCRSPYEKRTGDLRISTHNYFEFGNLLTVFCLAGGLPPLDDAPRVYIPEAAVRSVDALGLPDHFVAVHCTARDKYRDWTVDRWRSLASELARRGVPLVEIGLSPVLLADATTRTDLCGRLGILETAEVIRRAALFVGVESGPGHLANAVGAKGVVLIGRSKWHGRYMPYSGAFADGMSADLIQWEGPVKEIPVERVLASATARISQSPTAWKGLRG